MAATALPTTKISTTVASVGPAVQAACQSGRGKLVDMARADRWPDAPDQALDLANGAVIGPDGRIPIAELMAHRAMQSVDATAHAEAFADRRPVFFKSITAPGGAKDLLFL